MLMQNLEAYWAKTEDQCGSLLHLVVGERAVILKLLAEVGVDVAQRVMPGNALTLLDLGLDSAEGVRGLALQGDSFVVICFAKNLHSAGTELDLWSTSYLSDVTTLPR